MLTGSAHPERFHGTGPFEIKSGRLLQKKTAPTYTDCFSSAICLCGREEIESSSYYGCHARWDRSEPVPRNFRTIF